MSDAVLFHNSNTLEFEDVRQQVLRIPDVIAEIRRAQAVWDESGNATLDFLNYLNSEDSVFFQSGSVKEMIMGIVQVGLFKRHVARHGMPQFILGDTRNVSAAMVASGQKSFEEMLLGSRAASQAVIGLGDGLPNLRGQLLPQYRVFKMRDSGESYEALNFSEMVPSRCLRYLAEECQVRKVIAIGPGAFEIPENENSGLLQEIVCHESIDMDPLLAWFWPTVKSLNASA